MIGILGDDKDNEGEQKINELIEIFLKKAFIAWDGVNMESATSMKLRLHLSYLTNISEIQRKF